MNEEDMKEIAKLILDCVSTEYYNAYQNEIKDKVKNICIKYPLYE